MTIVTTIIDKVSLGNKKMIIGKSVLSGTVTEGDVQVPLKVIDSFVGAESASGQAGFAVEEDFPLLNTSPTVHISTTDGTFYWRAIGNRG